MPKRILIVDDEPDIRTTLKQAVESQGYKAAVAESGQQAIKMLERESFDLILMDIFMPQMSGRDTVQKIRENKKTENQKIAFITVANLSEAGKRIIRKLKPVDYIQKPVDFEDFVKRLKKMLK